jgi:hypothetical protein
MKKTIAALALMAATSTSYAMPLPRDPNQPEPPKPEIKTVCLEVFTKHKDGSFEVGGCDMVERNERDEVDSVKKNGCPKGQVAIKTAEVEISACPTRMQL